jgi:radical SAM protein with 4Fe4S-binding SPASM domain
MQTGFSGARRKVHDFAYEHDLRPGRVPPVVSWILTGRCNMRCSHCYPEASPEYRAPELGAEAHLAAVDKFAAAGVRCVVLSGGEVLVLRDAVPLLAAITDAGMLACLCTNGSLINPAMAKRLKAAGVALVSVSIDGSDAASHDRLRQYQGAFEKAVTAIQLLSAEDVPVMADYTATRINRADVNVLRETVMRAGAKGLNLKRFRPIGRGHGNAEALSLELDDYRTLVDNFLNSSGCDDAFACTDDPAAYAYSRLVLGKDASSQHSLASRLGCLAGLGWFGVMPGGDVTPCPLLPVPIGNILNDDLPELFASSPIVRRLLDRDDRGGACGTCPERSRCGGCRAHALATTGDYLAEDPYCLLVHAGAAPTI